MSAELFSVFYQFADVFAFLILSAAGLAIVFGMMGVINMAHGEFIMCGAYVRLSDLVKLGVPLADRPGACRGDGGVDRRGRRDTSLCGSFYNGRWIPCSRPGASASIVTQSMLLIVGSSITGIGTPEGSFAIGDYTFSTYRLVLFACAVAVLIGLYVTLHARRASA